VFLTSFVISPASFLFINFFPSGQKINKKEVNKTTKKRKRCGQNSRTSVKKQDLSQNCSKTQI
jgi:hypothetical protein